MSKFFAMLSRMRFIARWSMMRNTFPENVQGHSLQCAQIAHALAVIRNTRLGGKADPAKAAEIAIYHETAEVITGDLPTPVKYYDKSLTAAYKQLENNASQAMLAMLPVDMRPAYFPLLLSPHEDPEWPRVKAADRLCAYLKCIEEERMGNKDFERAKASILRDIMSCPLEEVQIFMDEFVPAYSLTLDELNPQP